LIRKFHEAKMKSEPFVTIWGTGSQRRELLHVDDLADACFFLMKNFDKPGFINVGTGQDISILELAQLVQRIVGYAGEIRCDTSKPDGAPRKLLDVSKLNALGWQAKIGLEEGIRAVYENVKDKL
jgi:GDP-L-fucose synthase